MMVKQFCHCSDFIMSAMASQITSVSIVCLTVCPGADQRKHQSSASLAFVRGVHRWSVDSPHKGPVTWIFFHLMTSSCHKNPSFYMRTCCQKRVFRARIRISSYIPQYSLYRFINDNLAMVSVNRLLHAKQATNNIQMPLQHVIYYTILTHSLKFQ